MKVYRYLSKDELNSILSGKTENLGNIFVHKQGVRKNTHKYQPNTKYLHFFKNHDSMKMMSYLYRNIDTPFYFCTFEIPFHVLALHGGNGYYPASGYDNITVLKEYCVSVDKFNPTWLKDHEPDTERNQISFEDVSELSL